MSTNVEDELVDDDTNEATIAIAKIENTDELQQKEMELDNEEKAAPANLLAMPTEVLLNIFARLDHDSLQALLPQCLRIRNIVRPLLWAKRNVFLAIIEPFAVESKRMIADAEKYLKRVLRTNEDLTALAHKFPINRGNGSEPEKVSTDWFARLMGFYKEEDYFALERRTSELLEIALKHCYEFANYYNGEVNEAFDGILFDEILSMAKKSLSTTTVEQMRKRFNFLVFQDFMHKNPLLIQYTDVHWPEQMPEKDRTSLAMQYAEQKLDRAPTSVSRSQGRMYEMRTFGRVGNPTTSRRLRSPPIWEEHDYYFPYRRRRHNSWENDYRFDWRDPNAEYLRDLYYGNNV